MKNKKKMAIASLIISIISLTPFIILPDSLSGTQIFVIVGILLAIAGAILGFVSKSEAKGLAIAGIVIGIISCVILCFSLICFIGIKNATNCVDNGNGTATCDYLGQELEAPISYLTEEQMKKGE